MMQAQRIVNKEEDDGEEDYNFGASVQVTVPTWRLKNLKIAHSLTQWQSSSTKNDGDKPFYIVK